MDALLAQSYEVGLDIDEGIPPIKVKFIPESSAATPRNLKGCVMYNDADGKENVQDVDLHSESSARAGRDEVKRLRRIERLAAHKEATKQKFEALARSLGFDMTIEEFDPTIFGANAEAAVAGATGETAVQPSGLPTGDATVQSPTLHTGDAAEQPPASPTGDSAGQPPAPSTGDGGAVREDAAKAQMVREKREAAQQDFSQRLEAAARALGPMTPELARAVVAGSSTSNCVALPPTTSSSTPASASQGEAPSPPASPRANTTVSAQDNRASPTAQDGPPIQPQASFSPSCPFASSSSCSGPAVPLSPSFTSASASSPPPSPSRPKRPRESSPEEDSPRPTHRPRVAVVPASEVLDMLDRGTLRPGEPVPVEWTYTRCDEVLDRWMKRVPSPERVK